MRSTTPASADELVPDGCGAPGDHHANTSRPCPRRVSSSNGCRSRRRTPPRACRRRTAPSLVGRSEARSACRGRGSRSRSASTSASARSCVQSRIVASWIAPHLADEVLNLELGAWVEPGRRLVEQEQHRRGQQRPRERDLLLHARARGAPSPRAAVRREADAPEDLRDLSSRVSDGPCRRTARRRQVLLRRHLLEEARPRPRRG